MKTDIDQAVETLKKGGIILYPTDTIWGLGCDATNETAVRKIFELKQRDTGKQMLVLMENPALLDRYVREVPEIAYDLIELATSPLTLVFPNSRNLAASLLAADGSIGIRFTKEAFSSELIRRFRKPIVSSSANFSGTPAPVIFDEIDQQIIEKVDYVVKFRQDDLSRTKPSSILKIEPGGIFRIIRE